MFVFISSIKILFKLVFLNQCLQSSVEEGDVMPRSSTLAWLHKYIWFISRFITFCLYDTDRSEGCDMLKLQIRTLEVTDSGLKSSLHIPLLNFFFFFSELHRVCLFWEWTLICSWSNCTPVNRIKTSSLTTTSQFPKVG